LIKQSTPIPERANFGGDLFTGFSNLTFRRDQVQESLDKPFFDGKYLTAVGKNEWADMKWNQQSIADKKNIINGVDIVFTAGVNAEACIKGTASLKEQGVNHHVLDCSDAHSLSSSDEKDRIGNCFTWIKSDPTFIGLRHALVEFDNRVFIGDEPDKLKQVRENPTRYIKSIRFAKLAGAILDEIWFRGEVPLNSGLVAVIGNKGSGKSAFADTIGLLGNSHQDRFFSFLHDDRFRNPKHNKSKHFEAQLEWVSGLGRTKSLDLLVGRQEVELVKYIPQNFLERVCNESDDKGETDFDRELKKVIFSHVPEEERLSQDSLDSLLAYKTRETEGHIGVLRSELRRMNFEIVRQEGKLEPSYREQIQNSLDARLRDQRAHESLIPTPVLPPPSDLDAQVQTVTLTPTLEGRRASRDTLLKESQIASAQRIETNRLISVCDRTLQRIENFRQSFDTFKAEMLQDLVDIEVPFEGVARLELSEAAVISKRAILSDLKQNLDQSLNPSIPTSLPQRIAQIGAEIVSLQSLLDEPNRRYQIYLQQHSEWTEKQLTITGAENVPGSVLYFKNLLDGIAEIPEELEELRAQRRRKMKDIFDEIKGLAETYKELYRAVKDFINEHPVAKDTLQLNFEVAVMDAGFEGRFFDQINRGISGSFCGLEEGQKVLRNIVERFDFDSWDDIDRFTTEIVDHIQYDRREPGNARAQTQDLIRKGYTLASLYDYIFSLVYLEPRYTLRLADKELSQLSPGEKGALLLIFYLLVDRGQIPLIIDQPEENLDNQTMFKLLVPCLQDAKKKRQIIIVTHNPNLAVVADAEQVVHAFLDKSNQNEMIYSPGALENPTINRRVLDVLEGTRPAFENRSQKYQE
jgi:hypothetical protein